MFTLRDLEAGGGVYYQVERGKGYCGRLGQRRCRCGAVVIGKWGARFLNGVLPNTFD